MKVIEVPVFDDNGSVDVTFNIGPQEAKDLLTFAVNFLTATGKMAMIRSQESLSEFADKAAALNG